MERLIAKSIFFHLSFDFMQDFCNNQGMSEHKQPLEGASALLSFTVENAHSYRDETEFSMVATRLAEDDARRDLKLAGLKNPIGALPVAGIFGANASGKTTLLRAMVDMRIAVNNSFSRGDNTSGFRRFPFLLDTKHAKQNSIYAIEVIIDVIRWQYGYEVDDERVIEEYAYYYPKGRRSLLFYRKLNDVEFGTSLRPSSSYLLGILRVNSLILSTAGATGNANLNPLFQWFKNNLIYIESESRDLRIHELAENLQDTETKKRILDLIHSADLGITDIKSTPPDPIMVERAKQAIRIMSGGNNEMDLESINLISRAKFIHRGIDSDVELDSSLESMGTLAWTSLLKVIIDALTKGNILLIDELDSSLHPHLVDLLISIFQSDITNPNCSQIIFNSHDIEILNRRDLALGRDQIWFTEKDNNGVTTIYSLSDFKPRNNENLGKSYTLGRYGGIPLLLKSDVDLGNKLRETIETPT